MSPLRSPQGKRPPAGAPDALAPVRGYAARAEHLLVGLMTGTSADAVDAVLVRFRGLGLAARHEVVAYRETPLEPALRREVLEVAAAVELAPERLMRLDAALGERFEHPAPVADVQNALAAHGDCAVFDARAGHRHHDVRAVDDDLWVHGFESMASPPWRPAPYAR